VSCGSFSPPTVMHTRIFETARDHLRAHEDVLKLRVIGGFISPVHEAYGKKGLAPAPDRIEMVRRALVSSDWVACDEWEVPSPRAPLPARPAALARRGHASSHLVTRPVPRC
jgi:nicotinamide mononucleotide adenylyltransferase